MNKEKTILIIGNGSSVLNHDFGNIIDEHPNVARINNYKINNYKHNIGSKTNIWFNGANSKLKMPEKKPKKTIVLIPSSILKKKEANLNSYVKKRLSNTNFNQQIVELEKIKKFESNIGADRLTTGLYSILWSLEYYNEVIIHGFDFFINSKSHYYNSKIAELINTYILNKGSKHKNNLEKEYVDKLVKNNTIKSLNNYKKQIGGGE